MTYVITQACCNDATCVAVCPVNCIHPTSDEPGFMTSESLYIDPDTCIDCGACVDECPVDAIAADDELTPDTERYLEINAAYYERHPRSPEDDKTKPRARRDTDIAGLRVAIVGSGPAACYAARELIGHRGVEVDMYDRLLTPYGLVRSGVAPDHQGTKAVTRLFDSSSRKPGFNLHLGVDIGTHITHSELMEHHNAVIYATGASSDRSLNIPGEELPGSHSATEFVGWYNGHPDHAHRQFDLSGTRAVIVGNGNVALDVARILVTDPDDLDRTDIADHALDALRSSAIREVVVIGRRGPAQAAYTNPELMALLHLPGVDVVIDPDEAELDPTTRSMVDSDTAEPSVRLKVQLAQEISATVPDGANKRIVLRFGLSPTEVLGADRVAGLRLVRNELITDATGAVVAQAADDTEDLDASLVLRSVGYRGNPIDGVPFDPTRGVIPNASGRVLDHGAVLAGVYTTGWIKRGPSGVIGTNKKCAAETVAAIVDDHGSGMLSAPSPRVGLDELLAERAPDALDFAAWSRVDAAEREAGSARKRSRVKFFSTDEIMAVVRRTASV